ncbi:MAG: hypothetical protein RLZZ402_1634, partial [Bacteroidota bacterium]
PTARRAPAADQDNKKKPPKIEEIFFYLPKTNFTNRYGTTFTLDGVLPSKCFVT